MENIVGYARHPAARVQHHFQGMQQNLARALDRQAAVLFDPGVRHFEQSVASNDDVGVLEVTVHKVLAVVNDLLTGERLAPIVFNLRVTSLSERARISAR